MVVYFVTRTSCKNYQSKSCILPYFDGTLRIGTLKMWQRNRYYDDEHLWAAEINIKHYNRPDITLLDEKIKMKMKSMSIKY